MSPVAFLLSALGICTVGVLLLLLRNRQPSGTIHGVRSFEREMRALDPKRNKVRHDPFGRPNDEPIDLRDERPSSGVSIVPPAKSSPSVVVIAVPKPDAPVESDTSVGASTVDASTVDASTVDMGAVGENVLGATEVDTRDDSMTTSVGDEDVIDLNASNDAPPAEPGEADRPRDEARG